MRSKISINLTPPEKNKKDSLEFKRVFFQPKLLKLGLGHFAGLDATGTNAHTLRIALAVGNTNRLKIRKEATLGDTGRMKTDAAFVLGRTLANDDVAG
jgi:hypothetical protein